MLEEALIIDDQIIDISMNNYVLTSPEIRKKQVFIIISGGSNNEEKIRRLFRAVHGERQ